MIKRIVITGAVAAVALLGVGGAAFAADNSNHHKLPSPDAAVKHFNKAGNQLVKAGNALAG